MFARGGHMSLRCAVWRVTATQRSAAAARNWRRASQCARSDGGYRGGGYWRGEATAATAEASRRTVQQRLRASGAEALSCSAAAACCAAPSCRACALSQHAIARRPARCAQHWLIPRRPQLSAPPRLSFAPPVASAVPSAPITFG